MTTSSVRQDKDADARLDYLFSWAAYLAADADGIASAAVEAPAGLTVTGTTITASTVRVFVEGGTPGTTYPVVNRIATNGGRKEDQVLELTITQSPATATFVAEDGSGKTTATSYASVAQADSYCASHLYATTWRQKPDATKQIALNMATRLLDETVAWKGSKASDAQALEWPRYSVYDRSGWAIDGNEIPRDLVNATAELARLLLAKDRTAEDDTLGFSRIKVGPIDITVDPEDRSGVLTDTIARMLTPHLGWVRGGGVVKLARS